MDWTTNNCATVRLSRDYETFDDWKKLWPGISNLEEECNKTTLVERTDTCAVSLVESIPQVQCAAGKARLVLRHMMYRAIQRVCNFKVRALL